MSKNRIEKKIEILKNLKYLLKEKKKHLARRDFHEFIKYVWYRRDPFIDSWHIKDICDRIQLAIEKFEQGQSSFIIMTMPPRHGKSEIVSRMLPAYFLGRNPGREVMTVSYALSLTTKFSGDTRDRIINTDKYRELFPNIKLSKTKASITDWYLDGETGHSQYAGLLGGITGSGYHLGTLDDYLKGRDAAESEVIREKTWSEFSQSFFTRRAPVSITLIPCTRWNVDDVVGRLLKNRTEYESECKIELIKYPAKDKKYYALNNNKSGYLFPNRFSDGYYRAQYKILGEYAASALLDCEPTHRGGNRLKVGKMKIIPPEKIPPGLSWVRVWDLASSAKERSKDDPDYTAGVLIAVKKEEDKQINVSYYSVYVKDIKRIQSEAGDRNRLILQTAHEDGPEVKIAVEAIAGYKDAFTTLRDILNGVRLVYSIKSLVDKEARVSPLEPIIEMGNFYICPGSWNREFVREAAQFPAGTHDDQIDAVASGYHFLTKSTVIY